MDLSNNRLHVIAAETFISQHQLRTLQLSGNPIEQLDAGCFRGLAELSALSLAYVASDDVRVDDRVFDEVAQSLTRLELDSSPGLVRAVVASDSILVRLSAVGDVSARSSDLVTVRDDLPQFLAASAVRLTSTRWHCDRRLIWLRHWLREASVAVTRASVEVSPRRGSVADGNRCATPRRLAGRTLLSLADNEFDDSTAGPAQSPSRGPTTVSTSTRRWTSPAVSTTQRRDGGAFYGDAANHQEPKLPAYRHVHTDHVPPAPTRGSDRLDKSDEVRAASGRNSARSTRVSTLIAVATTIGVTFVIVVVILTVIFRLVRGGAQKRPNSGSKDVDVAPQRKRVMIGQRQRAGTLYFMPASSTCNGTCLSAPTSRTRLDLTAPSALAVDAGARSVGEISALLPAANGREVAGRGTCAGEPLRMYKWEDF